MDPKKLLIVGFGPRGRVWAREIQRSRSAMVAGVVDPDDGARSIARGGNLMAFSALDEALAHGPLDGAVIATPPHLHGPQAKDCERAALHVLIEKPLSTSLETASEIAAAASSDRRVLAGQNFRFQRRELVVRRLLAKKSIGEIADVKIRSARTAAAAPRHVAEIPHGAIWDFCSHHFDALLTRFETEAVAVRARASSDDQDAITYSATIRLRNGVELDYEHLEGAAGYAYTERISGASGTITVEHQTVRLESEGVKSSTVGWAHLLPDRFAPSPDRMVLAEFVAAIDGAPASLDARSNLPAISLSEAVAEAIETGVETEVERIGERAH